MASAECEICGKAFDSERGLHIHESQVHSGHVCKDCGKEFDSERGLNIHRSQVHSSKKKDESKTKESKDEEEPSEEEQIAEELSEEFSLDEELLVRLIGGDIEELKNFVEEEDPGTELLNRLLKDEKIAQDRDEAKNFLENAIKQKKIGEDLRRVDSELSDVLETIDTIKQRELGDLEFEAEELEALDPMTVVDVIEGDLDNFRDFINGRNPSVEQMEELLEAEKRAKDRPEAKKMLKTRIRQKELSGDIKDAKWHIQKLRADFENIRDEADHLGPEFLKDYDPHEAVREEHSNEELIQYLSRYGYDEGDLKQLGDEELESLQEDIEEKKELLAGLDLELADEKLGEIDTEYLEQLKEEKSERHELIEKLKEKGLDEEQLESSSTKDLRKLEEEMDGDNENTEERSGDDREDEEEQETDLEQEEAEKDEEEMEKEAEEDLEMLMGARPQEEKDEEERMTTSDRIKEMKKQMSEFWSRPGEEEEKGINDRKVIELLEDYEEFGQVEKAIKTAHVMKGYLEFRMNINREMTYKELAETLEEKEGPSENLQVMTEFFHRMSEDEYLEDISIDNMDEVMDAAKQTVEEMG